MGRLLLTIDGGTTNTRLRLVEDDKVIGVKKLSLGARAGISDKARLRRAVHDGIREVLSDAGKSEDALDAVLACGMITSEGGLYQLPHIGAPAGIEDLAHGSVLVSLPEVCGIPIRFIPGVRIDGALPTDTDVMRGEECELFGLARAEEMGGKCAFILPGSHSKLIFTDEHGRIRDFFTALSGEMIAALSSGTILSSSVDLSIDETNDFLYTGYEFARDHGLNQALFKVRVLRNFRGAGAADAYSFFLGAILAGEIGAILAAAPSRVVVAGRRQIKTATARLLTRYGQMPVREASDIECEEATTRGMLLLDGIIREGGKCPF